MTNGDLIPARLFCDMNRVEMSFLDSLSESGLLRLTMIDEETFIDNEQLPGLEKWVRLHYDMEINLEGLEAIQHLLDQIKAMQEEMQSLRSRLDIYERLE